jgi:hypothetical protein
MTMIMLGRPLVTMVPVVKHVPLYLNFTKATLVQGRGRLVFPDFLTKPIPSSVANCLWTPATFHIQKVKRDLGGSYQVIWIREFSQLCILKASHLFLLIHRKPFP